MNISKVNISQLKTDYYKNVKVRNEKLDKLETQFSGIQAKITELEDQRDSSTDLDSFKSINGKLKDQLEQAEFIKKQIDRVKSTTTLDPEGLETLRSKALDYCLGEYYPMIDRYIKLCETFVEDCDKVMNNINSMVTFVNVVFQDNNDTRSFSFSDSATMYGRRQRHYGDSVNLKSFRRDFHE